VALLTSAAVAAAPAAASAADSTLARSAVARPHAIGIGQVPAPPTTPGCYSYINATWVSKACASAAYIQQHIPHPELLAGVGESSPLPKGAGPFDLGVVSAQVMAGGSDTDTTYGAGHYSLQDNTMFTGTNGHADGVQFTDQSGGGWDNLCIWQVDVTTQTYTPVCLPLPLSKRVVTVEGWSQSGVLSDMMKTTSGPIGSVVVGDIYGLGSGGRWNNNSGSVLGYGNGSQAAFSSTEERISVVGSECLDKAGFIAFTTACQLSPLKPDAYVGWSPGPLTYGIGTVESNNLIPVTAGLPPLQYPNGFTAKISYVASTTGKCFAGTPPNCD
jgi:hypothetical protein